MALKESGVAKWYYKILQKLFISRCINRKISPNKITILGTVLSVLVPFGFYLSALVGCIAIALSAIADSIDGQLARISGQDGSYGAFLDSTMDRVSDFFYLLGFWILCWNSPYKFLFTILFFIALTLTLLFSYTKARIEGLGGECKVGFMERAKRVIFLLIWGIIFWIFNNVIVLIAGILLYNFLLIYSVIQRINSAKKNFQ